ncbi:DUF4158 domain-containing protein [Streptomyces sp. NBC_01214]|uniref:DUF4158 domain-containing protein n=1 Tax=Streptomyces TaxID=1883 RepID=UPI00338E5E8C
MPTNFLSEDQRRRFGRFAEDPDEGQLAGSFLLDQTARRRAMAAKGARNRIGWAVQLGTVRYLGTFLDNPEQVPGVVVDYVAEQLGLDPAEFAGYGGREHRWDHQEQIRKGYGYTKFEFDQWFSLARWMYQRRGSAPSARLCCSTWPPSGWSSRSGAARGDRAGTAGLRLTRARRETPVGNARSRPDRGTGRLLAAPGRRPREQAPVRAGPTAALTPGHHRARGEQGPGAVRGAEHLGRHRLGPVRDTPGDGSRRWCVLRGRPALRLSPTSAGTGAWPPWWRSPR